MQKKPPSASLIRVEVEARARLEIGSLEKTLVHLSRAFRSLLRWRVFRILFHQ
mgnify:CR=1 FL=1